MKIKFNLYVFIISMLITMISATLILKGVIEQSVWYILGGLLVHEIRVTGA